jgi:glycosyltransferase involved in cell wall biosynthesis
MISVILCTYNRCQSLEKALASVAASTIPQSLDWEVLVVDNNSNDRTREVVDHFCIHRPGRIRYLFEPRPGKSHALNAGLQHASGDLIAFLDDDVVVDPSWLRNLTAPILEGKCAGAGGRILPELGFSPPRWLPTTVKYALAPLALFDLGMEAGRLSEAPFGTNMAFRSAMFEKYGHFRADLGPQPGSAIRNEDTEFGNRLLVAGEELWYEPSAVVYHEVTGHRLRREYFLAWWFGKGRADIREHGVRVQTRYYCCHIPLYLVRSLCVHALKWMVSIGSSSRFGRKTVVWAKLGQIAECYDQGRRRQGELSRRSHAVTKDGG